MFDAVQTLFNLADRLLFGLLTDVTQAFTGMGRRREV